MADRTFHGGDVLRKLRGKTPKTKFAKKAGLTRQTVARFEEAPAKAQPETIRRIAAALRMTPVELKEAVGLEGVPPDTGVVTPDTPPPVPTTDPPVLTVPVPDPVSIPGEGKQEGHSVRHENATMAFGLVLGMRSEDEQRAALEFLREWGRGKAAQPQPAAGRSES